METDGLMVMQRRNNMSKIKNSEEFVINNHFVTYNYKNGELTDISIQAKDGEVYLSCTKQQALAIWETLDEMQLGDL